MTLVFGDENKLDSVAPKTFGFAYGASSGEKMTDFRKTYKQVGCGQQNLLANRRALRTQRLNDQRRNRRSELFSASRGNPQGNPHKEPFKKQEAKKVDGDCTNKFQTLAKWREERNQRKLLEKLRAKPPFKVGIVHHRWYSPPITKDGNMKNKQKPENMRSKKNKIIKKVPLSSMGRQFKVPIDFNAVLLSPFDGRVAKKRVQMKKYFQNVFNDSVIKFLPEEFDTSTPTQTVITSIDKGISSAQKEEEERTDQFYEYLLNQETERLIELCNSLEHSKNEELTKGDDIYHLIEDCHAHFKKLEELE